MHPLTDALPDYLDALAMRQACGEIEAGLRTVIELAVHDLASARTWGGSHKPVIDMLRAALEATK